MYITTFNVFFDWLLRPVAKLLEPKQCDPVLMNLKKYGIEDSH
jgi:hypothetical protein